MRDQPRNILLVGANAASTTTLHTLTATPHGAAELLTLPLPSLAGSAPPAIPYDAVLLALPAAAAPNLSDLLEWIFTQLAPGATLLTATTTLIAAAVGDCFPPASAEVVLGASGFTPLASDPVSVATLLGGVSGDRLESWCRAVNTTLPALARTPWFAASPAPGLSFITPSVAEDTLRDNLLRSRAVGSSRNQLLIERHGQRVQAGLNAGLARVVNDLVVVAHEDVYLPPLWEGMLRRSLRLVEARDPDWGVLGCAGVRRRFGLWRVRRRPLGHARDHSATWGHPFDEPEPADTLDEFLVAFRRNRGFRFDEQQPNYHFYAVDLCLQAAARHLCSYAIEAFCYHNSRPKQDRHAAPSPDFLAACDFMRRKWDARLPIVTTCTVIDRNPARDHHARRLRRSTAGASR